MGDIEVNFLSFPEVQIVFDTMEETIDSQTNLDNTLVQV